MKGIPKFPKKYFEQYRITPLKLKPYSSKQKEIGDKFVNKIIEIINDPKTEITLRGSTLYKILGKGDIDIGIYATPKGWKIALNKLLLFYGKARVIEKTFAAFYIEKDGFEIEISLMKGHQTEVDKALTNHFLTNSASLVEYENLKRKYSYSKREYLIQRDKFFRKIIDSI